MCLFEPFGVETEFLSHLDQFFEASGSLTDSASCRALMDWSR